MIGCLTFLGAIVLFSVNFIEMHKHYVGYWMGWGMDRYKILKY